MMSKIVRVLLSVVAAVAVSGAARVLGAQPLAGTYDLALCRAAPCVPGDTVAAYFTATVVLLDSAAAARRDLPPAGFEREPANGCFLVRHSRQLDDSYAGIARAGLFRWRTLADSASTVVFPLYRSPDASYGVRVTVTAEGLTGSGSSGGIGVTEISAPFDIVVAVRVAEADVARCR